MQNFKYKTLDEIKPHLRYGDIQTLAKMLEGVYSIKTIESQLNGYRTIKPKVIEAANKLIESREQLFTTQKIA